MLNKLRNFSKGKIATVLVVIITIPFIFWGMGGVFSGGKTNSVAKINNFNISTENFVTYINRSKIKTEIIKDNIDENVLEDLLAQLLSNTLIDLEIEDQNIKFSNNILAKRIKKSKNFQDENNIFSRTKYEKFLLENNTSAAEFEIKLRNKELKTNFFAYISGGVTSPYFFTNNVYKKQTKEVEISYINLNSIYKKKEQFAKSEIDQFINENEDRFKKELIDFSYVKLTPQNLIQGTQFDENFFSKIDEIENLISNNSGIKNITTNFSLKLKFVKDYINNKDEKDETYKEIYLNRKNNKIQLIDKNDYYLLFKIEQIKKILPSRDDNNFINIVRNALFEKNKFDYNKNLLIKIQEKDFNESDFLNLVSDRNIIKKDKVKSIKEDNKFSINSIKLLYSLPKNSFLLMNDDEKNIYVTKIENIFANNIKENSIDLNTYSKQSTIKLRDSLFASYDSLMNSKYKIEINQKTLERVKNYFK